MGIVNRATPVAVVLAIVAAVTAILWLFRSSTVGPQHLVFFYLLPTAVVATFLRQLTGHAVRGGGHAMRGIFPLRSAL